MNRLLSYDYIYLIPLTAGAFCSIRGIALKWAYPFRILAILLISTLVLEIFAISWKWGLHKTDMWSYAPSNLWIYDGFLTIRHLLLISFFYYLLNSAIVKKAILWSAPVFAFFSTVNYFLLQTPHKVNTHTIIIANTITVVLVLVFFHQVLNEKQLVKLSKATEIWIALGTFIYYSGTLPFFIFFNYLLESGSPIMLSYLYINDFLNIVMYAFYLVAFLCKPQFQK